MEQIKIFNKKSHQKIKATLTLLTFKEKENFIAYAPSLDVSGYGKTENEAMKSFKLSIGETLTYCYHNNTLTQLLNSLGWHKNAISSGVYKAPTIISKINANEYLQEVINGSDQVKFQNNVELSFA